MKDQEQLILIKSLVSEGFTTNFISKKLDISIGTVKNYIRLIKKLDGTYNEDHIESKYQANRDFKDVIKPRSILDAFCGKNMFWKTEYPNLKVVSNDIDKSIKADINLPAGDLLSFLIKLGMHFDVVDIDPWSNPRSYIEEAIILSRKGLILTFGESPDNPFLKRSKDYYKEFYNIHKPQREVTSEDIANSIIKIGLALGKELEPLLIKKWKNCSRIYFKVINTNKKNTRVYL